MRYSLNNDYFIMNLFQLCANRKIELLRRKKMEIKDILKPDEFELLTAFSNDEIQWLNERIKMRKDGKQVLNVLCEV